MGVLRGIVAAAALTGSIASGVSAATIRTDASSFWVLGDSLSDPGNLFSVTRGETPASPPYFAGRFSNGPVWSEALSSALRAQGMATGNVAFGGARAVTDDDPVPDLTAQIQIVAPAIKERGGERPVAALWFGANDLIESRSDDVVDAAASAVGRGARTLADLGGVQDFLIFNLPDLGATPRYALFEPESAAAARAATRRFNATLGREIEDLRSEGLRVRKIDIARVFDDLRADPLRYGVEDATLPCLFPSAGAAQAFGQSLVCSPREAGQRAFFDPLHPNAVVHGEIGSLAEAAIMPIPLPASGLLLGGAVLALVASRLRRRKAG